MEQAGKLEKTWNLASVLKFIQITFEKYYPWLNLLTNQVPRPNKLWYIQKCTSLSCAGTCYDVTDLEVHGNP